MADLEDVTLDGRPLQSLRVADLKAALEERGLPKSGQKNALIKRLKGALMLENLQRTSTPHVGLQPNSQIGEEMSQNSFIKQYLAKQQELLRQRLEREAREAVDDDDDQEDHAEVNNSNSCPPPAQDATPVLGDSHRPFAPPDGEGLAGPANAGEGNRSMSSPHASAPGSLTMRVAAGEHRPERFPTSSQGPADSDEEESDEGEEDGEDDDWDSNARRRNLREPARGPAARERSGDSRQPAQHIPPLLSPQLRQPTPPPSPPPELSFPLPDTPKQSPPSPDVPPARQRASSTSSSGSSSSGSRSSSPEPQRSGHAERKPGPLTLLARKMESEGAFSGVAWHNRDGQVERQDSNSAAAAYPGRGHPEGIISAITHTANTSASIQFPMIPGTNQGIIGAHVPHSQVPVSVLRTTAEEERELQLEREKALEQERLRALELERQERQRMLEQERAMEEERERALARETEERERALEQERVEREKALERERLERQKALEREQRERELALEREREERERALAKEREERERALAKEREERERALAKEREEREQALARERALELERQRALEHEWALQREREEREKVLQREREENQRALELEKAKALERERLEREKALEQERLERERALEREREERKRIEREKALEQERLERERALEREREERERIEREKALELERERVEREKAVEKERLEREKVLEQERLERERLEREAALEQQRLEREAALEKERIERVRLEREKAAEQERLEREKALEQERERIERERAMEQKRLEREKALEQERLERERIEREKAALEQERLERERIEREKALERERIERERALEQERIEREKALQRERTEREKAEQERLEREKEEKERALELERKEKERAEKERKEKELELERERALENEKEERRKALEREQLEKDKVLEQEQVAKRDQEERARALEMEKEKAKLAERERESHLPPSKRGRDLTPLPAVSPGLLTGPGSKTVMEAGDQEAREPKVQPAGRDDQPAESVATVSLPQATSLPQSSFKKFRFIRDTPLQPLSSPSNPMVIKRPRTFSDSPLPQALPPTPPTKIAERVQVGPQVSAEQEAPQVHAQVSISGTHCARPEKESSVVTTLVQSPQEERATSLAAGAKAKADSREAEQQETKKAKEVDEGTAPSSPTGAALQRGRDEKKQAKRGRQRSSSSNSSSSDSDSGSSSSRSSRSSSSSSQDKNSSATSNRRAEEIKRDPSPQDKKVEAQAEEATAAPRASLHKRGVSVEEDKTDACPSKKPFFGVPAEEKKRATDSEAEGEKIQDKPREVRETAMTEPERVPETSDETPKAFTARRISLSSSKASPGRGNAEGEQDSGTAAGRKRRWGASTAVTAKKPSISITTDSLKSLIPDIRSCQGQEAVVDLHPEEAVLSGTEDDERERPDQDLQIRRTVTQVVPSENQENGQKEIKRNRREDLEEEDPKVQRERRRTMTQEEKTDTSFTGPTEMESPSHVSHDVEMNTVTPSDTLIRRSISQQKSGVSITIDDPVRTAQQLSPPRGKVSNIVHVKNLVRPFTLGQLKELLGRTGSLLEDGFWIDKIKSHCYVTYSSAEEAVATRAALHGVKWPQSNPKVLNVDFCQQEELDFHKGLGTADRPGAEDHASGPGRGRASGLPPLLPERDQWAEREREMERRKKAGAEREWDRDKVREFGKLGDEKEGPRRSRSRERRRKERGKSKEKKTDKKEKAAEEPPAKLLDDLFRKTKAAPCIYWLPLTDEQFDQREAARAERMKEREKRRKEEEDEQEKKKEEQRKERTKASSGVAGDKAEVDKDKDRERDRERDRDRDRGRGRDRDRENDKRRDGYRRPGGGGGGSGSGSNARRSRSRSDPRDRRR